MKVIYFGSEEHCPQCRVLRPRVEEWCIQRQIDYTYWDVDNDDAITIRLVALYNIKSIPSVVVKVGNDVDVIRGIDGWNEFIKKK